MNEIYGMGNNDSNGSYRNVYEDNIGDGGQNNNKFNNEQPEKSSAIVSLVCGIIGIVGGVIPVVGYFTWIFSIIAIVFGVKSKKIAPSGMATAGFVLGIVGLALLVLTVACVACAAFALVASGV